MLQRIKRPQIATGYATRREHGKQPRTDCTWAHEKMPARPHIKDQFMDILRPIQEADSKSPNDYVKTAECREAAMGLKRFWTRLLLNNVGETTFFVTSPMTIRVFYERFRGTHSNRVYVAVVACAVVILGRKWPAILLLE
jgi:hypothetical protein